MSTNKFRKMAQRPDTKEYQRTRALNNTFAIGTHMQRNYRKRWIVLLKLFRVLYVFRFILFVSMARWNITAAASTDACPDVYGCLLQALSYTFLFVHLRVFFFFFFDFILLCLKRKKYCLIISSSDKLTVNRSYSSNDTMHCIASHWVVFCCCCFFRVSRSFCVSFLDSGILSVSPYCAAVSLAAKLTVR